MEVTGFDDSLSDEQMEFRIVDLWTLVFMDQEIPLTFNK